jgi:hypothetical protein
MSNGMITTSLELEEMAMEAAESDGRLARCPLKNMEREIHAHRRLLLHFAEMIQGHSAAIEVRAPRITRVLSIKKVTYNSKYPFAFSHSVSTYVLWYV